MLVSHKKQSLQCFFETVATTAPCFVNWSDKEFHSLGPATEPNMLRWDGIAGLVAADEWQIGDVDKIR